MKLKQAEKGREISREHEEKKGISGHVNARFKPAFSPLQARQDYLSTKHQSNM